MVEYVVGDYLVDKNVISEEKFREIADKIQGDKLKLGSIAVREKMLTEKQVQKIHKMQMTVNKKFGEIAVQSEGLTEDDINLLIKKQKDISKDLASYISEAEVISEDELKCELECFREDYEITEQQLEDIIDDDFDTIISLFSKTKNFYTNECYNVALKFIARFIGDRMHMHPSEKIEKYSAERVIAQKVVCSECSFVIGFGGTRENLHKFNDNLLGFENVKHFEGRYLNFYNFINCISYIYECSVMRELYVTGISIPKLYKETEFTFNEEGFVLPVSIDGIDVDILVSAGKKDDFTTVFHNI